MSYLDDLKHDLADKAYREAYLEAVRADNDCNDQTMILAYRDVVAALEAQLAATEARECRTREALTAIRMLDPSNHHERRTTFDSCTALVGRLLPLACGRWRKKVGND